MAVYGHPATGEIDETTAQEGPGDLYTQTKREGERIVNQLHRTNGLPVVVIQPTCVYGPYGLAFTIDPLRELRTRNVALVDGGAGLFPYVYIDDVVDALVLAATEPTAAGETFLISGEAPVTFRSFYGAYEAMLGRTATIGMKASEIREYAATCSTGNDVASFRIPSEHVLRFYCSKARYTIAKAQRLLGYRPAFGFERGMQITKAWAQWAELIPPTTTS
jgi:nucleoside-diphosphate-sugar epimerase